MKNNPLEPDVLALAMRVDRLMAKLKRSRKRVAELEAKLAEANAANDRVFVAHGGDSYTCEDCFSPDLRARLGDVEIWEEGSHGWIGQPKCSSCKLSIPVYVDGDDVNG
jgi:hypothetical protein